MCRTLATAVSAVAVLLAAGGIASGGIIVGKADLATDTPAVPAGEGGGANQASLYTNGVMPTSGLLTKVTLRNDTDTNSEQFGVLVMRPTGTPNQYTIIHNQQFTGEDDDSATTGTRDYPTLLPVEGGDVLAHWWPLSAGNPGPIPFTNGGPVLLDWPVVASEVDPGDTLNFTAGGLTRDYFLNATLEPATILGKTDLMTGNPGAGGGDGGSSEHLFLHQTVVVPEDGMLTKQTLREDSDIVSETANLLVLRPTGNLNEYTVIHRVEFTDDLVPATTGTTDYPLAKLAVEAGDVLAHWWDTQPGGPIPFTNGIFGDTRTAWDTPVLSGELGVGDTYTFVQAGGPRDYWFNVTHVVPEPATALLWVQGLFALALCRRRKRPGRIGGPSREVPAHVGHLGDVPARLPNTVCRE